MSLMSGFISKAKVVDFGIVRDAIRDSG